MTLFMIGIGLYDAKDISLKALETIKQCDVVFLEGYTSLLHSSLDDLESLYGKKVIELTRTDVEQKAQQILDPAKNQNVAFLVIGDVFSATTHSDLFLRAKEKKIDIHIIHGSSILTAVGATGLELYKFGKTTSMPYFEKGFTPTTPYEVVQQNQKLGLHTLVLLDIKKDQHRFMTVNEALQQFLEIEAQKKENVVLDSTLVVGCARLGGDAKIVFGSVKELLEIDFGKPLHCLIFPGKMHFMEEEMLGTFLIKE